MVRGMGAQEIFQSKQGSRERGSLWQIVASNLSNHGGLEVTARSVRDRFGILAKKQKLKTSKEKDTKKYKTNIQKKTYVFKRLVSNKCQT